MLTTNEAVAIIAAFCLGLPLFGIVVEAIVGRVRKQARRRAEADVA